MEVDIKNIKKRHLSILEDTKTKYNPKAESESAAGFVGLKILILGAISYGRK